MPETWSQSLYAHARSEKESKSGEKTDKYNSRHRGSGPLFILSLASELSIAHRQPCTVASALVTPFIRAIGFRPWDCT